MLRDNLVGSSNRWLDGAGVRASVVAKTRKGGCCRSTELAIVDPRHPGSRFFSGKRLIARTKKNAGLAVTTEAHDSRAVYIDSTEVIGR
jgi:hypothetical protein